MLRRNISKTRPYLPTTRKSKFCRQKTTMTKTLTLRLLHLSRELPREPGPSLGETGIPGRHYNFYSIFTITKLNFDREDDDDPDFEGPADIKKARDMAKRDYR